MPNPSKYTQGYDFSGFQDGNPATPLPADRLDTELANASQSTKELRDAIMDIRRSDGALVNGIVTRDSLSSSLAAMTGIDRGAWVTATAYVVGDLVTSSSREYQCLVAHTSGTFATDLAAGKWALTAAESAEDAAESAADAAASAAEAAASVANVVHTIEEGNGITVDATDTNNPIVALAEPLYLTGAAADAGAGDTDDTAAIQALIDTRGVNGVIVIPPGNYYVPGDLTIHYSGGPDNGGVRIEATGARFTGGGTIIVDESKMLSIVGLDAETHEFHLRGCWHGYFLGVRAKGYVVGEAAGTGFNSCAWNIWENGYLEYFIVHENMSTWCNHNTFRNCNLGAASGISYAIELNANQPVQNLLFEHCDVYGGTSGIYNIGAANTSGDVEMTFNNCYLDAKWPTVAYGRNNVSVRVNNAHAASKFVYASAQRLRGQTKGPGFAKSGEWTQGWLPWAAGNVIPNGDFNLLDLTLGYPISNANGATLSIFTATGEGPSNRYARVVHASGTTFYAATTNLPFTANYCASIIMRAHSGASAQTLGVSLDNKESFTVEVGTEWTEVQVAPNDELTGGSSVNLSISAASALDIDIAYIGVHLGEAGGPLMLPQSPAADAATKSGSYTPTGTTVSNLDSVTPGAARWTRQGNLVTAFGSFAADATAAASTSTSMRLSLPIPSSLSSFSQLNGVASNGIAGDGGANIIGDATNDAALVSWQSLTTGSRTFQYTYQYLLQ